MDPSRVPVTIPHSSHNLVHGYVDGIQYRTFQENCPSLCKNRHTLLTVLLFIRKLAYYEHIEAVHREHATMPKEPAFISMSAFHCWFLSKGRVRH